MWNIQFIAGTIVIVPFKFYTVKAQKIDNALIYNLVLEMFNNFLIIQIICSYALWPLSAIMGVEIADAGAVAKLLGIKIFVDEFISFRDLAILVKAGKVAVRPQSHLLFKTVIFQAQTLYSFLNVNLNIHCSRTY